MNKVIKNNVIKKKVKARMNERIKSVQEEFNKKCDELDDEFFEKLEEIADGLTERIVEIKNFIVENIVELIGEISNAKKRRKEAIVDSMKKKEDIANEMVDSIMPKV